MTIMELDEFKKRVQGHRERLRKRFLEGGIERFSDEEVIEFLLTLGTPRKDVKPQAREALRRFGSLAGVLSAPIEKLMEIRGIGPKNAMYLSLVHHVAKRYLKDRVKKREVFTSSKEVFEYLFYTMKDLKREIFKVLLLNRKNELIDDKDLFYGTLSQSAVYPREVISLALEMGAASLIFVHNHPSGDPTPSKEDRIITRDLLWACHIMQITVLDHIILGKGSYFSFADQGLIREYMERYYKVINSINE